MGIQNIEKLDIQDRLALETCRAVARTFAAGGYRVHRLAADPIEELAAAVADTVGKTDFDYTNEDVVRQLAVMALVKETWARDRLADAVARRRLTRKQIKQLIISTHTLVEREIRPPARDEVRRSA
jgi:NAD(P)-dependent dehydrogenase (short-subunit alcohol dehydrogenase family)